MRVRLLAHTRVVDGIPGFVPHNDSSVADADELAEQAGRLCYLSWHRPNPATATNHGYLANILSQGHFSVVEHASATFYIDGVTRNFTHELIRHRHLSYSEVSQRYVDVSKFDFVEHPGLNSIGDEQRATLKNSIEAGREAYGSVMKNLTDQGNERKQARQAARHALPSGTETMIVVSGNMRAWRDMLWKRLSPSADTEFQKVARLILDELKRIAPAIFQDFDQQ